MKLEIILDFMRVLQVQPIYQNFANNANVRPVRKKHKKSRFENCIVKLIGIREYEFIYRIFDGFFVILSLLNSNIVCSV